MYQRWIYNLPNPEPGQYCDELLKQLVGKKQIYIDALGYWKEVPSSISLIERHFSTAGLPRISTAITSFAATDRKILSTLYDATGLISITPLSKSVPALVSLSPTFCRLLQNTPLPKRNRSLGQRAQGYHDYFNQPDILTVLGAAALDDGINVLKE